MSVVPAETGSIPSVDEVGAAAVAPRGPVLLTTKLYAPSDRDDVISRPELIARLADGLGRKLTLVDAPAGWGKTTVLAEWYAGVRDRQPVAWVSLDPGDNDPARFWTYVIEALRTLEPELGATPLAQLRAPLTSLVDVVLPVLVNELATIEQRLVLILDDYHVVTSREIHEGIGFLVEHLPPTLHLMLATRSDPPLPLGRMRGRGELSEIRAEELRFDQSEVAAFLNDRLGLGLAAADVARLQQRTEGWAAGLYLAALSLRGRDDPHGFIEAFAGDDRHIVDYLGGEVLDRQPEELRAFLLRTSILDRLSGPLCDAVTEDAGSAETLGQIERSNLFLVPLDTTRRWYRYHRLFGELLRHELKRRESAVIPTLHRRASAWYREEGMIGEAVHHATTAGDLADAQDLVARHWSSFFNEGRLATVSRWLDALADEARSDPRLAVARAWIAMDLGRLDEVDGWIEAAAREPVPGPMWDGTASREEAVAILRLVHRFKIGDVSEAAELAGRALESEHEESPFGQTVTSLLRGIALRWCGDSAGAVAALEEAAQLAQRAENPLAAIYALGYLASLHTELGELERAHELAGEALALADHPGRAEHFVTMMAHLAESRVLAGRDDLAEAAAAAGRALELSTRGAGLVEVAFAHLVQAEVRARAGDLEGAREALERAERTTRSCRDPGVLLEELGRLRERLAPAPKTHPPEPSDAGEELSDRELAVLRLLPTALSQREIGVELYVSMNTVKTHIRGIFRKLRVSTRTEAVAKARERGLL